MSSVLTQKLLIHKIPKNPQPEQHAGIGIIGCRKVAFLESKAVLQGGCIEVFKPEVGGKTSDPEMCKGSNFRPWRQFSLVLIKKLTCKRRVAIGKVCTEITHVNTRSNHEVAKGPSLI